MSTTSRQQALLIAEAWQNLYANQSYVDFASYSQDNLVNAILNYVKINYPDSFNDWITNSEFVIKVRTLAWLHQNLSYRLDLNVRENFIQTATRRQSILNLAENVFYTPNRVTGASGQLRVSSIMTNQPLTDSNSDSITNVTINWNDPANPDWFEQFMLIMNSALTPRTQFGHPLTKFSQTPSTASVYMLNSRAPSTGVYPFSVTSAGNSLPFGYINVSMDPMTGVLSELPPSPTNAQMILYYSDGLGSGSAGTGFFLPIRQGSLVSINQTFVTPQTLQTVTLGSANCDNNTIFVQQLDTAGNVILNWTKVSTLYGQSVAFNTLSSNTQTIFEVHTLINDQIEVLFGDGKFGAIPTDNFRFWYRTVNPVPIAIQPTDINNQVFVIPYVSNNIVYFLTITSALVAPISNGISTDSNLAITQAMGGSFAAQNRMVTGQDYNLFPLNDPSILKLNAVNRTYSGHSAYSKITDPTGFYSGVQLLGEDGRLFRSNNTKKIYVSALTNQVTLDEIVLQYLTPLIQNADKSEIYYEVYNEIVTTDNPLWSAISSMTGNIKRGSDIIPVGSTAIDEFKYCVPGTYLRYRDLSGPLVVIDHIIGNGTTSGAISLGDVLADAVPIVSLMPPIRNQFNNEEMTIIKGLLYNLQDFGISWNQTTQSWNIISNSNLDKTGQFSISHQNDDFNIELDASWLVYLRYIPATDTMVPQWEIVDRGLGVFFESARDVSFAYANTAALVDPYTGKMVRDNVSVLGVNEGRDSFHRLGLSGFGISNPINYDWISDGITTCYSIRERVFPDHIFVFVDNLIAVRDVDYTINDTVIGQEICYISPPSLGLSISIRINGPYQYASEVTKLYPTPLPTTFFPIVYNPLNFVNSNNTFFAIDGILQSPNDYTTSMQGGISGFYVSPAIGEVSMRVLGYAFIDLQTNIFQVSIYTGDDSEDTFSTNCSNQSINTIVVMIDGVLQSPSSSPSLDYTITDASNVVFTNPPATNTQIVIYAQPRPNFVRSAFFTAVANGTVSRFANFTNVISHAMVIVSVDGIIQQNPDDYTIDSNGVTFISVPVAEQRIDIFVVYQAIGYNFDANAVVSPTFLLENYIWNVTDLELTIDGYTDINGVEVSPNDSDFDGFADNPYEFNDILISDGITDLVLWRMISQNGFSVWNPVDETTVPKATYGFEKRIKAGLFVIGEYYTIDSVGDTNWVEIGASGSTEGISFSATGAGSGTGIAISGIAKGISFYNTTHQSNDIHLDQTLGKWLIADPITGNWIEALNQSDYRSAIGRSGLTFIWSHYPADNTRIDPAISNIIDMYILTAGYDVSYRNWISSGFMGDVPLPSTSESLQNAYGYFNNYRMTDDALVFRSISYLPLFGSRASAEHQGTFLVIKTLSSVLSDNDLRLRIIHAIDVFFQATNQDLGGTFYLSELTAFIHRACAPELQSIVLVANDGSPFGTLSQVRCASDQLFISVAQPLDVKIVNNFNDDNLHITHFN